MLRLITIPISHFCEKARWALDRAGMPYREEPRLQVLHLLSTVPKGGRSTPLLLAEGEVLTDSTDILRWIDARIPEDRRICEAPDAAAILAWEERFDRRLGPDGRAWMYQHFLPRNDLVRQYGVPGIPGWQRAGLPVFLPMAGALIRRGFRLSEARAARCRDRCLGELDEVAALLADGRPYLLGDRFTAADLTFAALLAPLLLPREYGVPLPLPEEVGGEVARVVAEVRAHPAGIFAQRLYSEER